MLQYASVVGLVKTLLIIMLIYFGVKILSRLFAPFLVKYVAKKAEQRFGDQFGQFQRKPQQEKPKREGEVTIDKIPNTKTSNNDVGDYVDFEEVE
ncbi:DUF4834 family protein [Sabulilitoribacter arenilitoris]|uniref:DUF4834 family protein n=1 Tax=Wocania arenilitoris TaxID=2044858 RepID=A0AAE3EQC7_9FLAO|nr:DUF4834 family protein [Wocania arenilitoris]MCF7569067.1 DUF4834 family protein [Wocania arenilitoris]